MSRLELLPCGEKRDLVDVFVNPVAVLKVVLDKRVDNVERGKDSDQITIIIAGGVEGLFVGCFFRWSSRSQTFL